MIKQLISFDFDGTLIHTPTAVDGTMEWEKKTGLSFQGRGWWGNPESLNINIFHPPVNQWVYKYFEKYQSDDSNYVFIATGRLSKLEKQVRDVLDLHNIKCDLFCNTGGDTFNFKCYLFSKLLKENPHADLIMFDDRKEHIDRFIEWAEKIPRNITIIDVVNKLTYNNKSKING